MFPNKKDKGFTLIELMVVISIIGMLSSVMLVSLASARNKAKWSKAYQTMVSINQTAFACVSGGNNLNPPAANGTGGTAICSGGSVMLPDISSTGFIYATTGYGAWCSNGNGTIQDSGACPGGAATSKVKTKGSYLFSIIDISSLPWKVITCGTLADGSGWFVGASTGLTTTDFNFGNDIGCKKTF